MGAETKNGSYISGTGMAASFNYGGWRGVYTISAKQAQRITFGPAKHATGADFEGVWGGVVINLKK